MFGFFVYLTFFGKLKRRNEDRVLVIFVLVLFVVFFWAAFEQAGGLMNLYTDTKVDRDLFTLTIPTTWFQSVNSIFIVGFAPLFAMLWTWLAARGKEPRTPTKMALGLLLVSVGFVLMYGAARQSAAEGKAALLWVVGAYLFHTWGELALSPVGLSMVTKLAPPVRLGADGRVVSLQRRRQQAGRHAGRGRRARRRPDDVWHHRPRHRRLGPGAPDTVRDADPDDAWRGGRHPRAHGQSRDGLLTSARG